MNPADENHSHEAEILAELRDLRRRVGALLVVVMLLLLMCGLLAAADYGSLFNYFGGSAQLYVAATAGAALLGFLIGFAAGWFSRRRPAPAGTTAERR